MALREYDFENTPTVSIVKKILTDAIKMEATDIHFDPTPDELVIKFRINGDLKEYTIAPENVKTNIITRIKIISSMNINDSLIPQVGTLNFELDNKTHNMQISSLPVLDGEKIVVHISNYAENIKTLNDLDFTESNTNKIKNLLKEQQGMILITGNNNSGKTTTTYSILKELNDKSNNIISIEDPVKMRIKGVNQVQIAPEKGLTYRNTLKNVMLQDPNIIAINELVDDETTRVVLRASLSGRLIISTMHTKTAYQTIDTLLNMDIENYLLGSNLNGIISQRLVKKLCPTCRELKHVTPYEASVIKEILGTDVTELYYPKGCSECHEGYIEQIPIAEVIEIDEELRNAISNNKKRELIRNIIKENSDSIIKDGLKKVLEGKTSFEEIIRIIDLKVDFTNDDKKIKDIILGNASTSADENDNETQPIVSPEKENEIVIPTEENESTEEKPFIKVEIDNDLNIDQEKDEEKNNTTNIQVNENELKNMISQIEENETIISEEEKIETNITPTVSPLKENNKIIPETEQNNETSTTSTEENEITKEKNIENNPIVEEKAPIENENITEQKEEQEKNTIKDSLNNLNESESPIDIKQENQINEPSPQIENVQKENTEPSPLLITKETDEQPPQEENNIPNSISTINNEVTSVESNESTIDTPPPASENTVSEVETQNVEKTIEQENEIKETNTQDIQPINFDEDDDDDDFNYGDSYINNF